jgi:hypothetical protein
MLVPRSPASAAIAAGVTARAHIFWWMHVGRAARSCRLAANARPLRIRTGAGRLVRAPCCTFALRARSR